MHKKPKTNHSAKSIYTWLTFAGLSIVIVATLICLFLTYSVAAQLGIAPTELFLFDKFYNFTLIWNQIYGAYIGLFLAMIFGIVLYMVAASRS